MKIINPFLALLLATLLSCVTVQGQAPHAPVTAGGRAGRGTPQEDSAAYEAARQKDRENIKRVLQQSRENLAATTDKGDELRTRKLLAKGAIYVVLGAIALVVYIRKKKKAGKADTGHSEG